MFLNDLLLARGQDGRNAFIEHKIHKLYKNDIDFSLAYWLYTISHWEYLFQRITKHEQKLAKGNAYITRMAVEKYVYLIMTWKSFLWHLTILNITLLLTYIV